MKSIFILTAIYWTMISPARAQNPAAQFIKPGVAVSNKGDTLRGDIRWAKKEIYLQNMSMKFADNTSKGIGPKNFKYVRVGDMEFESVELPGGDKEKVFMKILSKGKINFYQYDYELYQFNTNTIKNEYYARSGQDGELLKINTGNAAKKLDDLMKDRPDLIKLLEDKNLEISKIKETIDLYNFSHKSENK
ncbi:MAG: hypothetical protein NZM15_07675 [Flavobacteriales bacterium]|nr:hypothetical protein [Flavobacteriales bacterium]MDW8432565.1 hypothetical protein [Flavobacteriales bacterium]